MKYFLPISLAMGMAAAQPAEHGEAPAKAPFEMGEDSFCVNDWWNLPESDIINLKVPRNEVVAFGIYTVHKGVPKLSAQLYPLYPKETREVRLEIEKNGAWSEIGKKNVEDIGWRTSFRITDWDDTKNVKYRLRHGEKAVFEGLVRKNPRDKKQIVVAALSCNSNKDRGLRPEYTRNPKYDSKVIDTPGLQLLGEGQEIFLAAWAEQREGVAMKAVLSQTGFCGGAHIHGHPDNRLHADLDSNGWPQSGRKRAIELIRQAYAVHIAGDQHIATLVRHGIDEFRDGP